MDGIKKQLVILVVSSIGVYLGFEYALPLLFPFLVALLLVKLLMPIIKLLKYQFHIPFIIGSVFSLAITIAIFGCVFGYLWFVLSKELAEFINELPNYTQSILQSVYELCKRLDGWFHLQEGTASQYINNNLSELWSIIQTVVMPYITQRTYSLLIGVITVISMLLIIIIAVINIAIDYEELRASYLKSQFYQWVAPVTSKLGSVGLAYLRTQGVIMTINAVILVIGFYILKNPYAWLAGIGIAIADAFPALGAGIFLVPWALIRLFQGEYMAAIFLIALYALCELVRSFIEPRMFGGSIGIKPIYTLMAMVVGFQLFGIFGFLLGPLGIVIIRTILEVNGCLKPAD